MAPGMCSYREIRLRKKIQKESNKGGIIYSRRLIEKKTLKDLVRKGLCCQILHWS